MMQFTRALILMGAIFILPAAFALTVTPATNRNTSSNSVNANQLVPLPWTELTGGTANFTQTLDNTHLEHPLGFHFGVQSKFAMFHFGLGVLGVVHSEEQQSGTYNQVNVNESLYMETANIGVILSNFIILDGGFGIAQMRRSVSDPYGTPSSTTNTTASGTGWTLGGTVVPIRTKAVSLGASFYYFDATGNSYSQDAAVGNTQTTTSAPAKIHSYGSLTGLTLLFNY